MSFFHTLGPITEMLGAACGESEGWVRLFEQRCKHPMLAHATRALSYSSALLYSTSQIETLLTATIAYSILDSFRTTRPSKTT